MQQGRKQRKRKREESKVLRLSIKGRRKREEPKIKKERKREEEAKKATSVGILTVLQNKDLYGFIQSFLDNPTLSHPITGVPRTLRPESHDYFTDDFPLMEMLFYANLRTCRKNWAPSVPRPFVYRASDMVKCLDRANMSKMADGLLELLQLQVSLLIMMDGKQVAKTFHAREQPVFIAEPSFLHKQVRFPEEPPKGKDMPFIFLADQSRTRDGQICLTYNANYGNDPFITATIVEWLSGEIIDNILVQIKIKPSSDNIVYINKRLGFPIPWVQEGAPKGYLVASLFPSRLQGHLPRRYACLDDLGYNPRECRRLIGKRSVVALSDV